MYTAIVLVCASGVSQDPSTCYTYTLDRNLETYAECRDVVFEAVNNRAFYLLDEFTGYEYDYADFHCVNWNAERV